MLPEELILCLDLSEGALDFLLHGDHLLADCADGIAPGPLVDALLHLLVVELAPLLQFHDVDVVGDPLVLAVGLSDLVPYLVGSLVHVLDFVLQVGHGLHLVHQDLVEVRVPGGVHLLFEGLKFLDLQFELPHDAAHHLDSLVPDCNLALQLSNLVLVLV